MPSPSSSAARADLRTIMPRPAARGSRLAPKLIVPPERISGGKWHDEDSDDDDAVVPRHRHEKGMNGNQALELRIGRVMAQGKERTQQWWWNADPEMDVDEQLMDLQKEFDLLTLKHMWKVSGVLVSIVLF